LVVIDVGSVYVLGMVVGGVDVGGDVGRHGCGWAWMCWALT